MLGTYVSNNGNSCLGNAYRVATMHMFVDMCIKSLID